MADLVIAREEWSEEAECLLAPICADDDAGGVANIKRQVVDGVAALFSVRSGNQPKAYYVVRIDVMAGGLEMVIIAGAGRISGVPLMDVMLPAIEAQAMASGCRWTRIHTNRRGMYKRLPVFGYEMSEIVFRKEIAC